MQYQRVVKVLKICLSIQWSMVLATATIDLDRGFMANSLTSLLSKQLSPPFSKKI